MVWGEMANAAEGHFSERAARIVLREWERIIRRDENHPRIIDRAFSKKVFLKEPNRESMGGLW